MAFELGVSSKWRLRASGVFGVSRSRFRVRWIDELGFPRLRRVASLSRVVGRCFSLRSRARPRRRPNSASPGLRVAQTDSRSGAAQRYGADTQPHLRVQIDDPHPAAFEWKSPLLPRASDAFLKSPVFLAVFRAGTGRRRGLGGPLAGSGGVGFPNVRGTRRPARSPEYSIVGVHFLVPSRAAE